MSDTTKPERASSKVGSAYSRLRAIAATRQEPDAADCRAARGRYPAAAGSGRPPGQDRRTGHRAVLPCHERCRRRPLHQPPFAFRRRCRDRIRQEGRWVHRAGRRRGLPGDGRRCSRPCRRSCWRERWTRQANKRKSITASSRESSSGLVTAALFDRYHTIKLPSYLGFFGGRRFVPIVVSLACLFIAFGMSYFYPSSMPV